MDYRRSTIAVTDVSDEAWVVWHVATILQINGPRLVGAWVFPSSESGLWELLTVERRCWATTQALARLATMDFEQSPLWLDAEATHQCIVKRRDEVMAAHDAHVSSLPRSRLRVPPSLPAIPPILGPNIEAHGASPHVAQALGAARWFAMIADTWDRIEAERTQKNRSYLHSLGGERPLWLPLPKHSPDTATQWTSG